MQGGFAEDPNGAFKSSSVYIGIPQYPHLFCKVHDVFVMCRKGLRGCDRDFAQVPRFAFQEFVLSDLVPQMRWGEGGGVGGGSLLSPQLLRSSLGVSIELSSIEV